MELSIEKEIVFSITPIFTMKTSPLDPFLGPYTFKIEYAKEGKNENVLNVQVSHALDLFVPYIDYCLNVEPILTEEELLTNTSLNLALDQTSTSSFQNTKNNNYKLNLHNVFDVNKVHKITIKVRKVIFCD